MIKKTLCTLALTLAITSNASASAGKAPGIFPGFLFLSLSAGGFHGVDRSLLSVSSVVGIGALSSSEPVMPEVIPRECPFANACLGSG